MSNDRFYDKPEGYSSLKVNPKPDTEAARLLALGYKLCQLKPNSKEPVGDSWNDRPVTAVWEGAVTEWLHTPCYAPGFDGQRPYNLPFLTARAILLHALSIPDSVQDVKHLRHVKKAMVRIGYTETSTRVNGVKTRGYAAPSFF